MPERAGGERVWSLGVERPFKARLFRLEEPPLAPGRFRVATLYTGFSAGTELSWFKGTNPYLHAAWDEQLGVFRHGRPARGFPLTCLGYMEAGRVSESRSEGVAGGELVAMAYGHRTAHVADAASERFVPLPGDLDPLLGIFVAHMGPICANGLLHAAAELAGGAALQLGDGVRGRDVLVTGAGVVALLTGLFARHHGASEVAVADPSPRRLAAAEALGLLPVDETRTEAWRYVKQRWRHGPGDCGADVVFQCRGRPASLVTALRALRPQGTVIDLAFYQDGAGEVRLGEEFHHNGLAIRCAQIARVPRGLGHLWDRRRLSLETVALLRAHGAAIREHLVTDVVALEDAPALIEALAHRRHHALQVVFTVP